MTTCAVLLMGAGLLEWVAWRFQGHIDTTDALHMCDAAFAYQADQRYTDRDGGDVYSAPDQPAAESAVMGVKMFLRQGLGPKFAKRYYPPIMQVFHSAHVVRHVVPKAERKAFVKWLDEMCARAHEFWPKPDEAFKRKREFDSPEENATFIARHVGQPLPWEILDPQADVSAKQELIHRRLASLDWEANPYLRTPEKLSELGFEGESYTYS